MGAPPTLPADFFSKQQNQEAPATLPADFFSKKTPIPEPMWTEKATEFGKEVSRGVLKAGASTLVGLAEMGRKYIPGLAWFSDRLTPGPPPTQQDIAKIKEYLKPEGTVQKVAYGAEQFGEYFIPGQAITKTTKAISAGARFAKAFPKLAKWGPSAEYATRGFLEAAPAVTIAKAQGQEETMPLMVMAGMGPTFGKLLNKTGATRAAISGAKGMTGIVSKAIAEKIPEVQQSPRQMMWRALKPYVRNRDFDKSLDRAMPEIYEQAKNATKQITNVDDFIGILKATKKRIWAPYEKFLGETKASIDGNKIADAIIQSVQGRQAVKNPEEIKKVIEWANQYRHPMKLQDAEDWLQNVNAEIKPFYNMYPAMRNAALEAHPAMAASVREAEALRTAIYEKIDEMGNIVGQSGNKIAAKHIKEVYGSLLNLEQEAYRRVNVAKRLAPESLTEQMGKVHAAGEFAWGLMRGHPLEAAAALAKGTAYKKAAQIIKERNTSDYLIKQAFKDFGEYVEKAKKIHGGLPATIATATQKTKTQPAESAKITESSQVKPFTAPQAIITQPRPMPQKWTQYQELPTAKINKLEQISEIKNAPAIDVESLEPQVKSMLKDAVDIRLNEAKEIYESGLGSLSGKGKNIEDIGAMTYGAAAETKAGFGKIRVKSAIEELSDFKESPGKMAEAIEKDKQNALYLRIKKAVEEAMAERYAPEIEAAQSSSKSLNTTRPYIDQSILSPSGRVSEKSRKLMQERVRKELFGGGLDRPLTMQPSQIESMRRQAKELRELAKRGMKPKAYEKKAKELESKADELEGKGQVPF